MTTWMQTCLKSLCTVFVVVAFHGCVPTAAAPTCGDDACNGDETCATCAEDCGMCNAPFCGDGACNGDEYCGTRPGDCGGCPTDACGDGICAGVETCLNCLDDCPVCAEPEPPPAPDVEPDASPSPSPSPDPSPSSEPDPSPSPSPSPTPSPSSEPDPSPTVTPSPDASPSGEPEPATCEGCASTQRCDNGVCVAGDSCDAVVACTDACAVDDATCVNACRLAASQHGGAEWDALAQCRSACAGDLLCEAERCAAQWAVCLFDETSPGSSDCYDLYSCAAGCASDACVDGCFAAASVEAWTQNAAMTLCFDALCEGSGDTCRNDALAGACAPYVEACLQWGQPPEPGCSGQCDDLRYTRCTCDASDPCSWTDDGVCDADVCQPEFGVVFVEPECSN